MQMQRLGGAGSLGWGGKGRGGCAVPPPPRGSLTGWRGRWRGNQDHDEATRMRTFPHTTRRQGAPIRSARGQALSAHAPRPGAPPSRERARAQTRTRAPPPIPPRPSRVAEETRPAQLRLAASVAARAYRARRGPPAEGKGGPGPLALLTAEGGEACSDDAPRNGSNAQTLPVRSRPIGTVAPPLWPRYWSPPCIRSRASQSRRDLAPFTRAAE
uniref:Uncharacterized protein n=1 Tax=Sphaerodactylus townsendi TaxID=933632 RepID=A0ACB8F6W6_9SAUR